MSKKPRIIAAILFMYMSLICVGFSAWTISGGSGVPSSTEITSTITSEDAMLLIFDESSINKFSYFKTGFVNSNNEVVNSGVVSAKLPIDISDCKRVFSANSTLKIEFLLEQEFLNLFVPSTGEMSCVVTAKNGTTNIGNSFINTQFIVNNSKCKTTITINNFHSISSDLNIEIIYTFTISSIDNRDYFANTIFPKLYNSDFEFKLSAKITGE